VATIQPVVPRHAATVCLLRDGERGVEVFVMRRKPSMSFAPRMYVYPGGAVDPEDSTVPIAAHSDLVEVGKSLSTSDPVSILAAAARETFEECGVLIALDAHGEAVDPATDLRADRSELVAGRTSFTQILDRRGLVVDDGSLVPLTHWITPEDESRRYDARFLVAGIPKGQRTYEVDGEADRVAWIRPIDAMTAWQSGELDMWIPTVATMRLLTETDSVTEALAAARKRTIVPRMPHPVETDGQVVWRVIHASTRQIIDDTQPLTEVDLGESGLI